MNKLEILAPAGGFDSVIAAVRSGADAVYLGETVFSARASAHNFDEQALKEAVAYCHIHGVKVYVTLNTIVFDEEWEALRKAIIVAAEADADALIVQNLGVARLARQLAPDLALHASTQMSVHTAAGVRALYELGFKRVVLAREMSREEICEAAKVPVELEVFVHGALCMSVSGQCYFSAMLGSRSGNRGACAQTCRLPFYIRQKGGCALSLKDNSLIPLLRDLQEIGVASAKIEGRMKRPEYVAAAVTACREQLDQGFITDNTAAWLRGVFSRTGFTDGYYRGNLGKGMFGTRRKDDVLAADAALLAGIRQSYKNEKQHIPLTGHFSAKLSKQPSLTISDGRHEIAVTADAVCEQALKTPLTEEKCRAQLGKTGGTAYRFVQLTCDLADNLSLPLSVLNNLRRTALAQMDSRRAVVHQYHINREQTAFRFAPFHAKQQTLRARVTGTKLSPAFRDCELVFVPLFADLREIERLLREGFPVGVEIPRGLLGREKQAERQLSRVKALGVSHALCHNIGALYSAKQQGFVLHGGFGLNLTNTYDMLWAQEYGLADTELSFELTLKQINRLGGDIGRGILSYGYLPLMLCRNCPAKSEGISCKSCKNQSIMTDRKGKRFFLRCDGSCTEVLNCVPLYLDNKELSTVSISFHTRRFSVENYVETVENITDFTRNPMLKDKMTRGLYHRGVE